MIPRQKIPERIGRLEELAQNLWWSWNNPARDLFRALDYPLWRLTGHNPAKMLRDIKPDTLAAAAGDAAFLRLYDKIIADFDRYLTASHGWFPSAHPDILSGPVAYFSAEFAIHRSLPIYAGGLGILAGDICKETSDLGLPLTGIGFMYPQGYFLQRITCDGWQEEIYQQLNFDEAPIKPVLTSEGRPMLISVEIADRIIKVAVWQVKAGRTSIYLLDTGVESNSLIDRSLSARLYTADREQRIQQEIVLGIGGVRVIRALNIQPAMWHANEGHAAFMAIERIREEIKKGTSFPDAVNKIRTNAIFTTHTPVPAGHDVFSDDTVRRYLRRYWESLEMPPEPFLELGHTTRGDTSFNMTALGMKTCGQRNAVSRLHGEVTRRMWQSLWPGTPEEKIPIIHITNGVHVPTWVSPEMAALYEKYLGTDWLERQDDPALWERIREIPDDELWSVHMTLKRNLLSNLDEQIQNRLTEQKITAAQSVCMGSLLDPEVMTVGIIRRFAEYKRPELIMQDIERLKHIMNNKTAPLQIVFAGKAHPADFRAKQILHDVYSYILDPAFLGRIAFVEDYDMHIARYLVAGVDVWLNMPRRLQEASGTSGMKAAMNGVPH
jgi:starch phosphorylase